MVPAAQGQALLIGEGGEIVRMHALHDESDEGATFLLRSEHAHSRQFGEPFGGISCQRRIVRENSWPANFFEIINRGGEANGEAALDVDFTAESFHHDSPADQAGAAGMAA